MNHDTFMKIVDERERTCRQVLDTKGKIYSVDDDRLSNFKGVGGMNEETPQEALWGMVSKHIIATRDMIKSGEAPSRKWIHEYLGDIHNYMYLLEGLWEERMMWEERTLERRMDDGHGSDLNSSMLPK